VWGRDCYEAVQPIEYVGLDEVYLEDIIRLLEMARSVTLTY
jgi:hypothetical protein